MVHETRCRRVLLMSTGFMFFLMSASGCWLDWGWSRGGDREEGAEQGSGPSRPATAEELAADERFAAARSRMVRDQIEARGVKDPRVLRAMSIVPRHRFVPDRLATFAYEDGPLPIGENQTISQPFIVALMTDLLQVSPGQKVLEIGTGSGYQAAVLAEMGVQVYTIEIVEPLAESARLLLESMKYEGIRFRTGDGYRGWPEAAPFDGIIVTAAPDHVPQPLVDQLAVGARMVIPVGAGSQDLLVLTRTPDGSRREATIPVRFVPMTGEAREKPH